MKRKIIGAFLILALLVAFTCGTAYYALVKMDRSHSRLLDVHGEVTQQAAAAMALTERQGALLFSYIVEPGPEKEELLAETSHTLDAAFKELENRLDEGQRDPVLAMEESNVTFARLVTKVTDYVHADKPELARAEALLWAVPLTESISRNAEDIRKSQLDIMNEKRRSNERMVQNTRVMFIIVCAAAAALSIGIGLLLSRLILKPVRSMVRLAGRIADCDLTVPDIEIHRQDEIGQLAGALNGMKGNLLRVIRQADQSANRMVAEARTLSAGSEQVSRSSEYIAGISQSIAEGTGAQAESVEQSVEALRSMSVTLDGIAGSACSTREQSEAALGLAAEGERAVRSAEKQVNAIWEKMNLIADAVGRLGERAEGIVKANGLIGQIARQTNILAINASIEAARAGAEGKGFSVVAGQVRQLSAETSSAANRISGLMEEMRNEMAEVLGFMEAGRKEAANGMEVVHSASSALTLIHGNSEEAAELVTEAAGRTEDAARQAAAALAAVRDIQSIAVKTAGHVREVSACTQEQVAGTEEIASSAMELSHMAAQLKEAIGRFKTGEPG